MTVKMLIELEILRLVNMLKYLQYVQDKIYNCWIVKNFFHIKYCIKYSWYSDYRSVKYLDQSYGYLS